MLCTVSCILTRVNLTFSIAFYHFCVRSGLSTTNKGILSLLQCYNVLNYDTGKDKMLMEDDPPFISLSDRKRLATLYGSLRMLDDACHFRCRTRQ